MLVSILSPKKYESSLVRKSFKEAELISFKAYSSTTGKMLASSFEKASENTTFLSLFYNVSLSR